MSTEGRANTIVAIEWIFFLLGVSFLAILGGIFSKEILEAFSAEDRTSAFIGAGLISIAVLIPLFLNILLTKGVNTKHTTACKIWYVINIIFNVIYGIDFILGIFGSIMYMSMTEQIDDLFPLLLAYIFRGVVFWYRIWAVQTIMAFTKEVTSMTVAGDVLHKNHYYTLPIFPTTEKV